MRYVRLIADSDTIETVLDLDPEYVAVLAPNKRVLLRPLVTDPQPAADPTRVVDLGPIVIEPTQARQTWVVRDKTAAELAAEADENERLSLLTLEAFFDSPAPTTLVQVAQQIQQLKRVCKWLLRRVARA